jgi:nucleoside-diphosphate-sugar epimerase
MRVFVTGATGWVGSAVVQELIKANHSVTGMARSDEGLAKIAKAGATPHRGDIEDHGSLIAGVEKADAVIHCAFIHDFSKFLDNCAKDRRALDAMGEVLKGTNRPLIFTGGTALLAPGRLAREEDGPIKVDANSPRVTSPNELVDLGVKAAVVRLPTTVHGEGDHGFIPILIGMAKQKGVSAYIEDGANRWPAVHRLDAATVYVKALDRMAAGSRYHAVGEEGVPTKTIAEIIGRRLGLPVVSKTKAEANEHFGPFFGMFFGLDAPAAAAETKKALDWRPTHPGLVEDLDQPYYY